VGVLTDLFHFPNVLIVSHLEDAPTSGPHGNSATLEAIKSRRRQLSIAHRMLNILAPKIRLQRSRVVPLVRQRIPAGVTQHVRVRLEGQLGLSARSLDHAGEPGAGKGRPSLRGEYEGAFRLLLAFEPAQGTQLVPEDRMGAQAMPVGRPSLRGEYEGAFLRPCL
jgi:hypothetical protein